MTALVRPAADLHPALGDCEAVRAIGLAQPANALSSLAYVAAGAWIWARGRGVPGARHAAVAALANALGGLGFHGSGDRLSHWVHDVALVDTIASMAVRDAGLVAAMPLDRRSAYAGAATGAAVAVVAVRPRSTNALSVLATAAVGAGELAIARAGLLRGRRGRARAAAALALLAGALVNVRSRTGAPWCRPASRLQGHAAWHVLTALAIAVRAEGERGQA